MSNDTRSARRATRSGGIAALGFFIVAAVVFCWFGIRDLFADTSYGVRLRAAAMLGVGLYVLFAASTLGYAIFILRTATSRALSIIITGAITAIAASLLLTIFQLIDGDPTVWLAVWISIATGGALAAVWLFNLGARVPYPKQLAVTLLVTSLAGAANFGYTALYQPATQPVQFALDVRMDKPTIDTASEIASMPVNITFRNSGKVALSVLMTTYNIVGRKARVVKSGQSRELMNLATVSGKPSARSTVVAGYDVLQTDQFVFPGTTFEPDTQAVAGRVVQIPMPTEYDAIGINAWVLMLREDDAKVPEDISRPTLYSWESSFDDLRGYAPDWAVRGQQDFALYRVPIEETSYLDKMTRRQWEATVWRVFGDPAPGRPPGSYISFRFHTLDSPIGVGFDTAKNDNRLAGERYGVVRSETGLIEKSVHELGIATSSPS